MGFDERDIPMLKAKLMEETGVALPLLDDPSVSEEDKIYWSKRFEWWDIICTWIEEVEKGK